MLLKILGGEGGIRTLAAEKLHPTGLANPPLQPLEYLSAPNRKPVVESGPLFVTSFTQKV